MSPDETPKRGSPVDSLLLAGLALIVGALAAYGALGFIFLIGLVQEVFYGFSHEKVYSTLPGLPWWRVVLAPALGGLLVGLIVFRFMPGRSNQGPADVMKAVHVDEGAMPLRTGLVSALLSAISIGAGASVGRYGPAVHLGATMSAWIGTRLRLDRGQRLALLGCGVASAIAASFNAPLGGVLFASEVMLGGRALRAFIPITLASVVGTAITRVHMGEVSLFSLSDYSIHSLYEYPLFAVTGVLGGLLAIVFMRSMILSIGWVSSTRIPAFLRPMIGGLALGFLALEVPHVIGLGDEAIHDALAALFPMSLLLVLLVAKLVATSLSFGFGFSGGVFGPALFLGAMMGSAFGGMLLGIAPDTISSPSIYAVAGMGAVISCVIGAPIATILIAFELTSSYSLTTAVMLSVVFAGITTRRLYPLSYFKLQLAQREIDVDVGRESQLLRGHHVKEIVSGMYISVTPDTPIEEAEALQIRNREVEILVVDDGGILIGYVSVFSVVGAIRDGNTREPVSTIVDTPGVVLYEHMDLVEAMQALRNFVGVSVPVVESKDSMRLRGIVTENTVINAYQLAVEEMRDEERGIR